MGVTRYATLAKPQNALIQASTCLDLMVLQKDFYFKIAVAKICVLLIPIFIWTCSTNSISIYFSSELALEVGVLVHEVGHKHHMAFYFAGRLSDI